MAYKKSILKIVALCASLVLPIDLTLTISGRPPCFLMKAIPLSFETAGLALLVAIIIYVYILIELIKQRHKLWTGLLIVAIAVQAASCALVHSHMTRKSYLEASQLAMNFLIRPTGYDVSFEGGVNLSSVNHLKGISVDLVPIYISHPLKKYDFWVKPMRGDALIIQIDGTGDEASLFVLKARDYPARLRLVSNYSYAKPLIGIVP